MTLFTYGQPESSWTPRAALVLGHALVVLGVVRMLLGPGLSLRIASPRTLVLLGASVMLWIRLTLTVTVLLRRRVAWPEAVTVLFGLALYQLGFSYLGASGPPRLALEDALGIALFVAGSALNTGSELQRHRFKQNPANAGRLFTRGCFRWIRHPNFLGDILWVLGWAILTHRWAAVLIVGACIAGFVGSTIPHLSRYLRLRYDAQYEAWEAHTARLVPFVY